MRAWFTRLVALMFVLSIVFGPQIGAVASDSPATPVAEEAPTGVPGDPPADSEVDGKSAGTVIPEGDTGQIPAPASTPESEQQQRQITDGPRMSINANNGLYAFADPVFDYATGTLTISASFYDGFTADAGESFVIEYTWDLTLAPSAPTTLSGVAGSVVTLNEVNRLITISFPEAVTGIDGDQTGTAVFSGEVPGLQCSPSTEIGTPWINLWYWLPGDDYVDQEVFGDECPAISEPTIDWVRYDASRGRLQIETLHVGPTVGGQQVTLTYPTDKLAVDAGPFEVMRYSEERDRRVVVGWASASNGLITITFIDTGIDGEWNDYSEVELTGSLINATCTDSAEVSVAEIGELEFVTNAGYTFTRYFPSVLCNAAPASKTGEWSTDGDGNPIIIWTIDTGDVYRYAELEDYADFGGFWFDCSDTSPSIETISGSFDYELYSCGEWGFDIDFWSTAEEGKSEIFRAQVTIIARPDAEYVPTVYLNCARVYSDLWDDDDRVMLTAAANNGYGGEACAELFPPDGGGDFVTKTVDNTEAKPGDTLTYTITASTSADNWDRVILSDTLPAGVVIEPDSITCAIEPAIYMVGPCYTLTNNQISATAWSTYSEEFWRYQSGPVSITITLQGKVAANVAPGASIVNEACSQRHIFVPGGEGPDTDIRPANICASAVTNVPPAPDPTPTATPSPTATPAPTGTPAPTTPATPGVTVTPTAPANPEPTATTAVTGLPSTGIGASSAPTSALLLAMLVGFVLVAAAFGFRRTSR